MLGTKFYLLVRKLKITFPILGRVQNRASARQMKNKYANYQLINKMEITVKPYIVIQSTINHGFTRRFHPHY